MGFVARVFRIHSRSTPVAQIKLAMRRPNPVLWKSWNVRFVNSLPSIWRKNSNKSRLFSTG